MTDYQENTPENIDEGKAFEHAMTTPVGVAFQVQHLAKAVGQLMRTESPTGVIEIWYRQLYLAVMHLGGQLLPEGSMEDLVDGGSAPSGQEGAEYQYDFRMSLEMIEEWAREHEGDEDEGS